MSNLAYILVAAAVTYAVRVLPFAVFRKPIKNVFLRSFLYYVPYVTLALMTFPAICEATASPIAGVIALAVGIVLAWCGLGLFPVAVCCCVLVFVIELFI